ncbi:MAG: hypothetical protein K0R73_147 [Candidatus Midichloriaceae bacterium]|jgi:hypothetical protein|nr:hypothetical protein [Candidatus Midichloriaceae bacterium]
MKEVGLAFLKEYRENLLLMREARKKADISIYEATTGYNRMAKNAGGQLVGEQPRIQGIEEFKEWETAKAWFESKELTLDIYNSTFEHNKNKELSFRYGTIESINLALGAVAAELIEREDLKVDTLSANEAEDLFKYAVSQEKYTLALESLEHCKEQVVGKIKDSVRLGASEKEAVLLQNNLGKLFYGLATQERKLEDIKKIPVECITPIAAAQTLQYTVLKNNDKLFEHLATNNCISKISQQHLDIIIKDAAEKGHAQMFNSLITHGADVTSEVEEAVKKSNNNEIKTTLLVYNKFKEDFAIQISTPIKDGITNNEITGNNIAEKLEDSMEQLIRDNPKSRFTDKIRDTIYKQDFKLSFVENFKAFLNSWIDGKGKSFGDAQKEMLSTKFEKLYKDIQNTTEFKQMQKEEARSFVEQITGARGTHSQGHGV